jgi:hypothetical protein
MGAKSEGKQPVWNKRASRRVIPAQAGNQTASLGSRLRGNDGMVLPPSANCVCNHRKIYE